MSASESRKNGSEQGAINVKNRLLIGSLPAIRETLIPTNCFEIKRDIKSAAQNTVSPATARRIIWENPARMKCEKPDFAFW